jgi:hypothetical protein
MTATMRMEMTEMVICALFTWGSFLDLCDVEPGRRRAGG